jgi:predicted nucleic acid-binding protein
MKLYEKYLKINEASTSSLIGKLKKSLKLKVMTKDNHPEWKNYKDDKNMKYIDGAYDSKTKAFWMVYDDGDLMVSWGDKSGDANDPFDSNAVEEIIDSLG